MANRHGRYLPLSLARRMVGDFLAMSRGIPQAVVERSMNLRDLREAMRACQPRPYWQSLYCKAWGLVGVKHAFLRRSFVRYPWPRLYEHHETVGSIVMARRLDDEEALFYLPIAQPERRSLHELDEKLRWSKAAAFGDVPAFRRQLRWARLPRLLRRLMFRIGMDWTGATRTRCLGTFGMSVVAGHGIAAVAAPVPWTTMLHYTPFTDDGTTTVRVWLDHRIMDGSHIAAALDDLEVTLCGPILAEVRELTTSAALPRAA